MHDNSKAILDYVKSKGSAGKRVVFVSGNFNVVHPGHLRLLRFASECGDLLVVGVQHHDPGAHLLPEHLRLESIQSISFVNQAFVLRDPIDEFIRALKPSVVVKGKEHEDKDNPEQAAVESYGGKLLFSSGDTRFSSLDILKHEFFESNLLPIVKPTDFSIRHGFKREDLAATLNRMHGLRVTVVGDLIVDEYLTCDPLGMSEEDPTIVVTPIEKERFVGGAGIVAAHAQGLGAHVRFFSVTGADETAEFAKSKLQGFGVDATLLRDDSRPTTLKQRYRSKGKTLLRVSHLRQHDISKELMATMDSAIDDAIASSDVLIFSDFNYGCLPQALVDSITARCKKHGVMMVADSQSSSQVGDVSRFRGMALLTPTEREARLALRDFNSGLVILADKLQKEAKAANVVITLGSEGLLVYTGTPGKNIHTDRLPAMNTAARDPAGAGDSLLTTAALALATGADIWLASYLGALAAACQVGRIGNLPLTPKELQAAIEI